MISTEAIEKCIREHYMDLLSERGKNSIPSIADSILHLYPSYTTEEAVESYYENMIMRRGIYD